MKSGLLWYDANFAKTPGAVIEQCAARYAEKYGKRPNVAFVNAAQFETARNVAPKDITPKPSQHVFVNHIWMGNE